MSMSVGNYMDTFNPLKENPKRWVNDVFNAQCKRAGVSCMVGMNPQTYNRFYGLKNVGKKLVRVEYDRRVIFLEPGESIILEVAHTLSGVELALPYVDALNNGL
jgi:hypothetical protein